MYVVMQDRCGISAIWSVNNTDTDDSIDRNATYFNELLQEWNEHHTGRLTQTGYRHMIWGRVPDDAPLLSTMEDPSSGPTCPHYEIYPAVSFTCSSLAKALLLTTRHYTEQMGRYFCSPCDR